ncbi:unnamed protein product, partial [marine sediment metagenome]
GCGHYVGNLLYVEQSNDSFAMLEGDEIITIDDDNILYGTGLEDAYNGGYYYNWTGSPPDEPEGPCPQSAIRPLHGILYVHSEQGSARADQYRWQIADCVPFSESIEVNIENKYASVGSQWTSVAFWYQLPNLSADFNCDCRVDWSDFGAFASHWLQDNCTAPNHCGGADLDDSGQVNWSDFSIFANDWLWER